ncbi:hypothetical protein CSPAE12_11037 [Colletotrichum incanum]|nr:hypothetical protein CSPAE12_11037 [Colletotrichum incanum]
MASGDWVGTAKAEPSRLPLPQQCCRPPCRTSSSKDGAACKMRKFTNQTKHTCATKESRIDFIPFAWSNGNRHKHGMFFLNGWQSFICLQKPFFFSFSFLDFKTR